MAAGDTTITKEIAQLAVRVTEFWASVADGDPEECWPWTGYINEDGYGEFFFGGKMRGAHELAVTFTTGEIRDRSLDTCHSCDNPPCCNPRHVRFGRRIENVADMHRRGRAAIGSANGHAKLTETAVMDLRLRRAGGALLKVLASDFGVGEAYVSDIANGLAWRHVGGPITGRSKRTTRNGKAA